jgi:hypothetical protein
MIEVKQFPLFKALERFEMLSQSFDGVELFAKDGILRIRAMDPGDPVVYAPYIHLATAIPALGDFGPVDVNAGELTRLVECGQAFDCTLVLTRTEAGSIHVRQMKPAQNPPYLRNRLGFEAVLEGREPLRWGGPWVFTQFVGSVASRRFARRLEAVLPALGADPAGRYHCVKFHDARMCTTDGSRLLVSGAFSALDDPPDFALPPAVARQLPALLGESGLVHISIDTEGKFARFDIEQTSRPTEFELVCSLTDVEFPDPAQVIPSAADSPITMTVAGLYLESILERQLAVVGGHPCPVCLHVEAESITIEASNGGVSVNHKIDYVRASRGDEDAPLNFKMHLNARFLLDAIKGAPDAVTLKFADPSKTDPGLAPLLVLWAERLAVIMPRRM